MYSEDELRTMTVLYAVFVVLQLKHTNALNCSETQVTKYLKLLKEAVLKIFTCLHFSSNVRKAVCAHPTVIRTAIRL